VLETQKLPQVPVGAEIFAAKSIDGGPSVAAVVQLARAQSQVGYDFMRSNCQHYADNVYTFVGGRMLERLPNEDWLTLFRAVWPQTSVRVVPITLAKELLWNAQQAPMRVAVAGTLALWPSRVSPERPESTQESVNPFLLEADGGT